jgi:hypothetical protein
MQLEADDVEGGSEQPADPGLAARPGNPLVDAGHRRQETADALDVPDAVELAHG